MDHTVMEKVTLTEEPSSATRAGPKISFPINSSASVKPTKPSTSNPLPHTAVSTSPILSLADADLLMPVLSARAELYKALIDSGYGMGSITATPAATATLLKYDPVGKKTFALSNLFKTTISESSLPMLQSTTETHNLNTKQHSNDATPDDALIESWYKIYKASINPKSKVLSVPAESKRIRAKARVSYMQKHHLKCHHEIEALRISTRHRHLPVYALTLSTWLQYKGMSATDCEKLLITWGFTSVNARRFTSHLWDLMVAAAADTKPDGTRGVGPRIRRFESQGDYKTINDKVVIIEPNST
ncbi:hypothetical protein BGW38_007190 [Lunasporangiospora selenospora]|uniref:Uncharacterized protein n=1 Tax=Lunasporangiospora selenospora TaxID=979761 RepID=A0A9P6G2Q3_9FUNG|nr:hypothetical protein BGW38_007190 [Lunasporangiospora selenospora]